MGENWLPDDVLDRKKYADFLTTILSKKKDTFVLNINARWGEGKTFFIKKWIEDLSRDHNHPTIYFNAWENDFGGDPLIALLTAIENQLSIIPKINTAPPVKTMLNEVISSGGKLIKAAMPILAKGLAKKFMCIDIEELKKLKDEDKDIFADIIETVSEEYIQSHKETLKSIDVFKVKLGHLISEIEAISLVLPLYIFIDELDRCKPIYSIEVLEKLKHVFNVPGIVFIIATDTKQLGSAVRAVYGESFDGEIYLRRFFDQEYHLPDPDLNNYAKLLVRKYNYHEKNIRCYPEHAGSADLIETTFSFLSKAFSLTLRDQEQCFARFDAISTNISVNDTVHVYFLLFLIMLHKTDSSMFEDYFNLEQTATALSQLPEKLRVALQNEPKPYFNGISGIRLYEIYSKAVFLNYEGLKTEINLAYQRREDKAAGYTVGILQEAKLIKKYRDKVRLVGALS